MKRFSLFAGMLAIIIVTSGLSARTPAATAQTTPQCSDGDDNDHDSLVDIADASCHSDGNSANANSYTPDKSVESGAPLCVANPGVFEYTMTNVVVPDQAGSYADCSLQPPGQGWEMHDRWCVTQSNRTLCFRDVCLWRKPAQAPKEYTLTHAAGGNDCMSQVNPGGGYVLNKKVCFVAGIDRCMSDACLWERPTTVNPSNMLIGHAGTGVDENVDCSQFPPAVSPLGHSREDQEINIAKSTVSKLCILSTPSINCISDLCLWTERNTCSAAPLPQCRDGIDNDGDGATDFPADFSCSSSEDNDETNPKSQCQDGIDNDADGKIDFPQDPGCSSKQDNDESNVVFTLPACSDGIDNDGDGRTDFFDPGCYPNNVFNPVAYNPNDNDESNAAVLCRWARVNSTWVRQCI